MRRVAIVIVLLGLGLAGCKKQAGNPQEAAQILTATRQWRIDQILVNDAVIFRDGKMESQFGGVNFERYMETVELKPDGTFSGMFKGAAEPFLLQWKAGEKNISVADKNAAAKGGEWTIEPAGVSAEGFAMVTRSTAYDYPNQTKIELKFKPAQ